MATKKAAAKKTTAKTAAAKRKPNPAFMKELKPDAVLAKVVGDQPMPRTQVVKKLWEYIKANNLQDPAQKKMINADDNLRAVFDGRDQVSMFEMTKLVNKHLS